MIGKPLNQMLMNYSINKVIFSLKSVNTNSGMFFMEIREIFLYEVALVVNVPTAAPLQRSKPSPRKIKSTTYVIEASLFASRKCCAHGQGDP